MGQHVIGHQASLRTVAASAAWLPAADAPAPADGEGVEGREGAEALRLSERRYRGVYEQSPLPMQVFAPDGRLVSANRAWERLAGIARDHLAAYNVLQDRQLLDKGIMPYLVRAFSGETVETPAVRYDPGESGRRQRVRWVKMYAYPVADASDHVFEVVLVHEDVTAQREVDGALRAAAAAEQRARRASEAAVTARADFVAVAAHELKTPITSLLGFAQLLLRQLDREGQVDAERLRRALHHIDLQSHNLGRLVGQLLEVSRLDAGKLALERARVDLAQIVRGAVAAAQAGTDRHFVRLYAPAVLPANVDPFRIEQVVANLLDNAIRYSPEGGEIQVDLYVEGGARATLAVRDRGVGIPPEDRIRLFGRFFQAHRKHYLSGMGLGLFISREIVELHGGTIKGEFPPDGGSRFMVSLPLERPLDPPSDHPSGAPTSQTEATGRG